MELTRNTVKLVKSLQQKKFRREHQLFVVEGEKSVLESFSAAFTLHSLYATASFLSAYKNLIPAAREGVYSVAARQLEEMGSYQSNDAALAVFHLPEPRVFSWHKGEFVLALDDIRDPGNLGTIIRTADWFGVSNILCSEHSVEWHNPKVISASMGSFARVRCHYLNLESTISALGDAPVFGAMLDGERLHAGFLGDQGGIIIIGNEANGISQEIEKRLTHRVTIPRRGEAESLNAAIATGIILSYL